MTTYTFPQGSPAWRHVRCGIPTASEFDRAMSKREDTRRRYRRELLDEWLYGPASEDEYVSAFMARGSDYEDQARNWYANHKSTAVTTVAVEQVGFVMHEDGWCGGSPDGLVGKNGIIEIKLKERKGHIGALLGDDPKEHYGQCQGNMWLTGRDWCDLLYYVPFNKHSKPVIVRIDRDDEYISALAVTLGKFVHTLNNERQTVLAAGWEPYAEFDPDDYDPKTGELAKLQRERAEFDKLVAEAKG